MILYFSMLAVVSWAWVTTAVWLNVLVLFLLVKKNGFAKMMQVLGKVLCK